MDPMITTKTATLMLRIDPAVKRGLRGAAARERRSLSKPGEVLIRKDCCVRSRHYRLAWVRCPAGPLTRKPANIQSAFGGGSFGPPCS